jgi:hypothetical protein
VRLREFEGIAVHGDDASDVRQGVLTLPWGAVTEVDWARTVADSRR